MAGAFTLVVGGLLALAQDDLKRLHAYSSVSQVGFIALGLGAGSYLGYYGAVVFLVAHALAKGLLFLTTGALSHAARADPRPASPAAGRRETRAKESSYSCGGTRACQSLRAW